MIQNDNVCFVFPKINLQPPDEEHSLLFIYLFIYLLFIIYLFIYLFIHLFIHLFIIYLLFIYLFYSVIFEDKNGTKMLLEVT